MVDKRIIAAGGGLAIVLGGILLARRAKPEYVAVINPILDTEPTTDAEAIAQEQAKLEAVVVLRDYIQEYPSSKDILDQAASNILIGPEATSSTDLAGLVAEMEAYKDYISKGGELDYETFILYETPPEYKALIEDAREEAKDAFYDNEIAYLSPPEELSEQKLEYLQSGGFPSEMKEAYIRKYPEAEEIVWGEEEVTPEPVFIPPEPEPVFTATAEQLEFIEITDPQSYDAVIDMAYEAAAIDVVDFEADTGESYFVAWSADDGYYAISETELYSDPSFWEL